MVRRVVLGGGVPLVGPQEELWPEWIYSQGVYLEPKTVGEVRILDFD